MIPILALLTGLLIQSCSTPKTGESVSVTALPRIVVLTDINNVGGDPDDKQSMGHLLMYANQVEIRAIIPDYWKGKGVEATLEAIEAYEKDFGNPLFSFDPLNYPHPDSLRKRVAGNESKAIEIIIKEAKREDERPLYILVWGSMTSLQKVLFEAPEIANKLRVLTIATNLMADNPDSRQNTEVDRYCEKNNWNGRGRDEIFDDPRFNSLWWIENDWAYNGMFEGQEPSDFLLEIKNFGELGHYIWEVVQSHSWAHYFRAGDTPTLLYLLEEIDHDDPYSFTWGGTFSRPFPGKRPHYWIDDAGNEAWNYTDPCDSWDLAGQVYEYRVEGLRTHRPSMYDDFRNKMKQVYRSP